MDQKIVLIVGAGDYIGSAIARRFAKGGFTVCLGRRNGEKLEPIIKEIGNLGGVAYGFTLDARKEENVVEIFKKIEQEIGKIELVIFNVGGNVCFPILEDYFKSI